MTDKKRMHALVHGRVQGVSFREYTRREAVELGLAGWVRNLADGTVEVEFEGEILHVEALLNWLAVGSPYALVTRVDAQEKPLQDETGLFSIRRSA